MSKIFYHAWGKPENGDSFGLSKMNTPEQDPRWIEGEEISPGKIKVGEDTLEASPGYNPGEYVKVESIDLPKINSLFQDLVPLLSDPSPLVRIAARSIRSSITKKGTENVLNTLITSVNRKQATDIEKVIGLILIKLILVSTTNDREIIRNE